MYKFFVNTKIDNYFLLDNEVIKHLKVIRIKNEDFLVNYQNEFYLCNYMYPNKATIKTKLDINNELDFNVVVAIPLIKQSNLEIAIQKSVELGATTIILFTSSYTDRSNLNLKDKINRFNKIIKEAAQQSFRNKIPTLHNEILSFNDLLNIEIKNKYLAYENKKNNPLKKANEDCLLIVGPEGGFLEEEIKLAIKKNVEIVGLTKSILRTETALIYMLSKII